MQYKNYNREYAQKANVTERLARQSEGLNSWINKTYNNLVEGQVFGKGYVVIKRYPSYLLALNPHGHRECFHPTDVRLLMRGEQVGFKYGFQIATSCKTEKNLEVIDTDECEKYW